MQRSVPPVLVVVLFALVASGALLPLPRLQQTYQQGNTAKWIDLGPTGAGEFYGRTRAGDFDGDGLEDVAYLRDEALEALLGPALHEALMTDMSMCRDFVVVPGWPRDMILAATQWGLERIEWNGVPGDLWTRSSLAESGSAWGQVSLMDSWSQNGEQPHVFGVVDDLVGPDSRIVWLKPNNGSWIEVEIEPGSPVDTTHLVAFDYDTLSPGPELALVSSYGLMVFDPESEAILATHMTPGLTTIDVARLDMGDDGGGQVAERVAWMSTWNEDGLTQYLCTVGLEGMENIQNLGYAKRYYALVSGDVNVSASGSKGVDDLVLARNSSWGITWIDNLGTPVAGPNLASARYKGFGLPGSAGSSRARPVITDLDGDGDGDVLFPLQDENKLWIELEDDVDEEGMKPMVRLRTRWREQGLAPFGVMLDGGVGGHLAHMDFDLGPTPIPEATHIEVLAWQGPDPYTPVNATALTVQRKPIGQPIDPFIVPGDLESGTIDGFIFVSAQLLSATSSDPYDPPLRAYPPRLVLFHGDPGNASTALQYIQEEGVGNEFDVYRWDLGGDPPNDPPGGGDGGGEQQGGGSDAGCKPARSNQPTR